jgi:hypothetical protein
VRHLLACLTLGALLHVRAAAAQTDSTPAAVNKPTLTYLAGRGAAVLFGGYPQRGTPLGETWSLENGCWRQLAVDGPPPRAGHGAAYDAERRRLVVFGGAGADGKPLGDTWEFDGEKWEQRSTSGPRARMLLRLTFDERRKRVLLFGGSDNMTGPHFGDVWQWDGTAWARVIESGPPPRFESALAYDTKRDLTVVFGGNRATDRKFAEGSLGDTWVLRGTAWREVSGSGPTKRDHHAMAFHGARGVALMFGGSSAQGMLGDTWTFDGQRWAQQRDSSGPSARGGVPAMTYDSDRRKVVIYGGWGDAGALRDLWEWDGGWTSVPVSACRLSERRNIR